MNKFISDMSGNGLLLNRRLCMSSSVKTDWNCSFKALAYAQSDFARKGMPDSSPSKALIYDQFII